MEPDFFLEQLQLEGARIAVAARRTPAAPVPTCPKWDVSALQRHVTQAHHWFALLVRTRATEAVWESAEGPEDPAGVADWYDEGLAEVVAELSAVDPDTPVWNWLDDAATPVRFWHRRAAHETAVHRWDAENALGIDRPLDAALAADGIDEYLAIAAYMLRIKPVEGLAGSLRLRASDAGHEWLVGLSPGSLDVLADGSADAGATVEGTASDVLLWSVNRKPPTVLTVSGDEAIVAAWKSISF